ncbi:hypothetical protein SLEP1_g37054 [Rubroshorea leprosula]|uniref:Uncharacterized protein n=1 Tax=Rubroshorea leprosula TaxID=152421 RepID=A0AAV5KTU3_9ROSI|nr:hypothetical protein SLEP1_g37054 [Rubroshorea leprosula]
MKVPDHRWGFIVLCSSCFGSWGGRQFMRPGGVRTSTPGTLLSFTISGHRWQLFSSIARGRAALVDGEGLTENEDLIQRLKWLH